MEKKSYWTMLKNGDLRWSEKAPKKVHVVETRKKDLSVFGNQTTFHTFECGDVVKNLEAHCGYDRGPKLQGIVQRMLKAA